MAKLDPIDQISIEYVAAVRAEWNGDLSFAPEVLEALPANAWNQVDILEVVEDGEPTNVSKEQPHETQIEFTHTCLTGNALRITVTYDPHRPWLFVKEVSSI